MFIKKGSQKIWRTGPWNGREWNGIPRTPANTVYTNSFVNGPDEIYTIPTSLNTSLFFRLVLDESGVARRSIWLEDAQEWKVVWFIPEDNCDNYGKCGVFGSCNSNNAQICSCLPGYEPKSPTDWYLKDGSQGCVRKRELFCGKGDGFLKSPNMKLPDTSNARVDMSLGIKDCEIECRNNCSCTGYTSAYVNGSGCMAWFGDLTDMREFTNGGQDLFVRVDAIELGGLFQAWELWRDGRPLELVDSAIGTSFPEQEVVKFIQVGILCVQEKAIDRPTMSSALFMLSNETTIPNPGQPAFILTRNPNHPNSSSSTSVNEMSTTIVEGR
ncbi:hypothetical protein Sjap_025419 [Stephania japonica]|uniref:Apple domain-containing protein n=1 Tax=Stephania japonica TaxID=461633 RepID=A0AAP0E4T8_9MAGN